MNTVDRSWWLQLEPQWKEAFAVTFFQHNNEPTSEELAQLYGSPALRFAGPTAFYPNMTFELTNLSGIVGLSRVETLVVINHKLENLAELSSFHSLKHLFVLGNQISSLDSIADLANLEMLYVQDNLIESIEPIRKLTNLRELYVNGNRISSLEGLTEAHADKIENFFCMPNELLKQKELLRVEREFGIRCRSV